MSGGRAQLHPSAASCPPPSGVKFQPRRHRIPGWGPERPRPTPPFRAHLAAPPAGIWPPPATLGPPSRAGAGGGEETLGRDPGTQSGEPGRQRGAGTGRSEFVDARSRELGGWAEGGEGGDRPVPASAVGPEMGAVSWVPAGRPAAAALRYLAHC